MVTYDFNKDTGSKNIRQFLRKNSLFNVYKKINNVETKNRDRTFEYRSKCIDTIIVIEGIIEIIIGIKVREYNKIIEFNHRGYVFDSDL